jgi:Uma2 family endonuclease
MATRVEYRLLTAAEFLDIDFGERKAELDNGIIRMMAGARARHNRVAGNILIALGTRLRGTGCTPYNADMGTLTHDSSVRYPDVSVFCGRDGPADDQATVFSDPRVLFEVLSNGTARTDLLTKLDEYKRLPSVDTIVFVDTGPERVRIVQRTGPTGWSDVTHTEPVTVPLPALNLTIPHAEIFARD